MRIWLLLKAFCLLVGFGGAKIFSSVTHFENFLKVLKRFSQNTERLRFLQAVLGEVRADYGADLTKATLLYQQFANLSNSKVAAEAQAALELQQEIRRHLKTKNAELLVKAWHGNEFPNTRELLKFNAFLKQNYAEDLVHEIYATVIAEIYPQRSAEALAAFFAQIYVHGDKRSFELMLDLQLQLYWRFLHQRHVNDAYTLNMGNYFYQSQNDALYEKLDKNLRRRLTKAIAALPRTVHIFFFENSFCLKNRGKSLYLASRDNTDIDANRRYVQTSVILPRALTI